MPNIDRCSVVPREREGTPTPGAPRAARGKAQAGVVDGATKRARLSIVTADGQGADALSLPGIARNAPVVLQQVDLVDEARQLAAQGTACLRDTAERHVPRGFRDSFLNCNAVSLELQRLAIRPGSAAGFRPASTCPRNV